MTALSAKTHEELRLRKLSFQSTRKVVDSSLDLKGELPRTKTVSFAAWCILRLRQLQAPTQDRGHEGEAGERGDREEEYEAGRPNIIIIISSSSSSCSSSSSSSSSIASLPLSAME